jgi:hypothetical protein
MVDADQRGMLLPYVVLLPVFVIQIALPTRAGWIVAISVYLTCCSGWAFGVYQEARQGRFTVAEMSVLALSVLWFMPLYLLRPGAKGNQGTNRRDVT